VELTVVIPTRDRPQRLLQTLQALHAASAHAPDWEAVVVDDGGAPGSTRAVAEWIAAERAPVTILNRPSGGPAAARNAGAHEARGRALVLLDDDMVVAPGFLARHLEGLDRNPGCWIVGRITHPSDLRSTPFGRYRHARWEEFHEAHAPQGLQETHGISAANLALPAADFRRLGGFDEGFALAGCEDRELGARARAAGLRVLYDPQNVALHQDWAVTLDRYCERQRSYAISDVRLWRMQGDRNERAGMVVANAPLSRADRPARILRKLGKAALATPPGRVLLRGAARLAERLAPDRALSRRAYDACVAVAIFQGVREGLVRFPPEGGA
jgi:GT2 family glycosyltransferase